ncbi:MAG: pilus assembly protein PilB, partial [Gemmatimonadales bacterium]|nr:pilus assembly protein PilB [Gemmatimonadales bacterium]
AIDAAIQEYYSAAEDIEDVLAEMSEATREMAEHMPQEVSQSIDLESIEEMASSAPVRRLLNLILL